jgi:hypothetical protein
MKDLQTRTDLYGLDRLTKYDIVREVINAEKKVGVKNLAKLFSVFPTTVLTVSGSKGMFSVLI